MPNLKTVYFAPDGKWFDTYQKCQEYEKNEELILYLSSQTSYNTNILSRIIDIIKQRYKIEQHWDYQEPKVPQISEISANTVEDFEEFPSNNPPEDF
jgi:hypothetical protein